jgi:sec-independent protein translocase protein TatB
MNVFGVGPLELVVIMVVALIFVGPERLPRLAADLARTVRELRKYTNSLAAEFNEVIQDIEKETTADAAEWKEIGQGLSDAAKSVSDEVTGAKSDAEGTRRPQKPQAATSAPSTAANGAASNGVVPSEKSASAAAPASPESSS